MNDARLQHLLEAHLEGSLGDDERAELERALLESESARRQFWEHAALHGLLHEAVKTQWSAAAPHPASSSPVHAWRLFLRPVPLAFAALVVGVCSGSLVYAALMAHEPLPVPLVNAGFESPPAPGVDGIASEAQRWGGDVCRVTKSEAGITPREGAKMLRFLSPVAAGLPEEEGFTVSDQWLLVAVEDLPLREGQRTLRLSAWFNRAADATQANNRFGVGLYAFTGSVADGSALWKNVKGRALGFAETEVPTDNDPATWERGETQLSVPAGAQVILLRIHAFKQSWRDAGTPELIGHYADDVRLDVLTTPTARP